jgi:enoyl-CoA hydratase/carnithine racemase
MSSEVLQVDRRDGVAVLTIHRTGAGNSISAEVTAALDEAIGDCEGDKDLFAIVITGAGDKFFCSGGDIKQYRELVSRDELETAFARPRRLLDRLESLPMPVVAAVNGYALGGGAELMLACDIRFAAAHARIGFPYVRLGLMPGWNGVERLARSCGHANAMGLLAGGEPVSAAEAKRLGLVNDVVEHGSVLDGALAFTDRLREAAPQALAACKRALLGAYQLPRAEARRRANESFAELWLSADHREAEAAFADKRKPVFKGE